MLNKAEIKRFRTIGHGLKAVVTIAGNGASESVMAELNRALTDHELIKIKVHADDRDDRDAIFAHIVKETECEIIQSIGHVALIFKRAKKANPKLSNILRSKVL